MLLPASELAHAPDTSSGPVQRIVGCVVGFFRPGIARITRGPVLSSGTDSGTFSKAIRGACWMRGWALPGEDGTDPPCDGFGDCHPGGFVQVAFGLPGIRFPRTMRYAAGLTRMRTPNAGAGAGLARVAWRVGLDAQPVRLASVRLEPG